MTYHVLAGNLGSKEIAEAIKKGKGTAEFKTVNDGKIWAMMKRKDLWLKDEKGMMARVTIADVFQSNGVIHVIDTVLMPK